MITVFFFRIFADKYTLFRVFSGGGFSFTFTLLNSIAIAVDTN